MLLLAEVEKPNVLLLEFSEDVYLKNKSAFGEENMHVLVHGSEKKYNFKWQEIQKSYSVTQSKLTITLFDFEQSLIG